MATDQTNGTSDTPSATLTLRMLMQGKEVGSIIGKKGDNVKKYREESGAKINISDSSCPERIVTVTGTTDSIFKAFTMICKKFEEDLQTLQNGSANSNLAKQSVTIRLIVPASQCGSLIGKGGAKIKEIREVTGASVQVASDMLPNSTERTVTVSGTADSITQCIYHICCVMLESPPKGATIPYRPKPAVPPIVFAGGQAFAVQGPYAFPQPEQQQAKLAIQHGLVQPGSVPFLNIQQGIVPGMQGIYPATMGGAMPAFPRPNAAAPAPQQNNAQTHEMTIPNDLIGCIIGRGGSKINEIRQLSGATIKIANADEGSADRKVTITGTPETINTAQYLINASIEMHKSLTMTLDPNANPSTSTLTPATPPNPLATILSPGQLVKPLPLIGLNMALLDSAMNHKNYTPKIKGGASLTQATAALAAVNNKKVHERNKFAPY